VSELRILAFDPGQKNHSVAVVSYDTSIKTFHARKLRIVAHGLFPNEVTALVVKKSHTYRHQVQTYHSILTGLKSKYNPTHAMAERYMTRGFGGGSNTTEIINLLLGVMSVSNLSPTPLKLLGASQWKNEVKRQRLKQGYDAKIPKHSCNNTEVYQGFETARGVLPVSAHQVDACLIAAYGIQKLIGVKPFLDFDFESYFTQIKKAKVITLD
jgi:hypothetical protein